MEGSHAYKLGAWAETPIPKTKRKQPKPQSAKALAMGLRHLGLVRMEKDLLRVSSVGGAETSLGQGRAGG